MIATIEEALAALAKGEMIIVLDDEQRENEGDLVMAAEKATPEAINFMAQHGRGLICTPMREKRLQDLQIEPMVKNNEDERQTAFTVSVDFKQALTGISAFERSETIQILIDEKATAFDFQRPGHIFPLIYQEGGVLRRPGHTEAAVDLAVLAGLYPAGVICEIMKDDGQMARRPDLEVFAQKHDLKMISIPQLVNYLQEKEQTERSFKKTETTLLPTSYGDFKMTAYEDASSGKTHLALRMGDLTGGEEILVRLHSECLTGDVFGSLRCDCGDQLQNALKQIGKAKRGVLIYLRQEGRGIGLFNKVEAYRLQEKGMDTVEANLALGFSDDLRNYKVAAEIMADLGIKRIHLMTNNPDKIAGLEAHGLRIEKRIPLMGEETAHNKLYIQTKRDKMGHIF